MPDYGSVIGLTDDIIRIAAQTGELHRKKVFHTDSDGMPSYTRTDPNSDSRHGIPWRELSFRNAAMLGMPPISYGLKHRPKGEFAAYLVGGTVGLTTLGLGAFSLAPGFKFAAPILGGFGSKVASSLLVGFGSLGLGTFAARAVRTFANFDNDVFRIRMGGDYQDTTTAQALRFAAVRDIGSTLGNARSFIGREAMYLHK